MADGNLSKRIKEKLQPELDRMLADHDRFMQAAAEMPPPTEAQKRAIAEANSPEVWQRAMDAVEAEVHGTRKREVPLWSVAIWLGLIALTCLVLGSIRLLISN